MKPVNTTAPYTDPVCSMAVSPDCAGGQTAYKGQPVYFCSQGCLQRFFSAPQKYYRPHKKGFWRRYIERLDKIMAATPPSCHG